MKRARVSFIALAAAGVLALTACGGTAAPAATESAAAPEATTAPEVAEFPAGSTMAKLADAGKITVGTKIDQPLFGLEGPDGMEGFDVEIARIIASELGIEESGITWVETVSANREPFIQDGQVDIVVATYTINDKRKEVISFAGPYYIAGQAILVKADNEDIKTEADLVGKKVCSVEGSTPAKKLAELGADPVLTDAYSNCLEPLRGGQVVAVSTDNVILAGLAAQNEGEFKVAGDGYTFTKEPYGIGLKHEDDEFRAWINEVLVKAEADGRYEAAWEKTAGKVLPFVAPPAPDNYTR